MEIAKTGFILYTINYKECIHFYENLLELKVLYRYDMLTCFDFKGSYLMVEIDDETDQTEATTPGRDRTCIRLNVKDVKKACEVLEKNSIPFNYSENDWGTVAKFRDPDQNLIAFRSNAEHAKAVIENAQNK